MDSDMEIINNNCEELKINEYNKKFSNQASTATKHSVMNNKEHITKNIG